MTSSSVGSKRASLPVADPGILSPEEGPVRRSIALVAVLAAAVVVGVAACASSGGAPGSATEPPGPHLTVVATGIAFDTKELKLRANQATTIFFLNHDNGVPHNIAISAVQGGATTFDGAIITEGAIAYSVPAYGAGTYFFFCKVHPNMNGIVTVSPSP